MNREIKFRQFMGGSMQYWGFFHEEDGPYFIGPYSSGRDFAHTIPNMQFTGLQDKNGVDIYEGDIVNICYTSGKEEYIHDGVYKVYTTPLKGVVFEFQKLLWESYGYNQYPCDLSLYGSKIGSLHTKNQRFLYVDNREYSEKGKGEFLYPFNDENELKEYSRYFEVIGNIYENKELLND